MHVLRCSVILLTYVLLTTVSLADDSVQRVLIEAESFQEKGGWCVDQQFVHTMGSPYLLAHGMGKPVQPAKTTVTFPSAGNYYLWVRTKDWVPGPWSSPGRFLVSVNGHPMSVVFGTNAGWTWQYGGRISIKDTDVALQLNDLTGFDGRCDALFFSSKQNDTPPHDLDILTTWRLELRGNAAKPKSAGKFDVVVVGGGLAGCGAALVASQQGLDVALIHDRPLLGGNASSEVRVHTLGILGEGVSVLKGLNSKHWPNGSMEALKDTDKRHVTMEASDVKLYLSWRACAVETQGQKITSVDAQHIETGQSLRFLAPLFIDCTGDGWIGYWAGADFRYGRESKHEFNEGWDEHGDLWSPEKPDNRVMGSSLLWNSHRLEEKTTFPDVPWAMDVSNGHAAIKGEWYWEYSANHVHQIDDAEAIRDHMLRAIYGSFAKAKENPENAHVALKWVGFVAGKRESRRLMGDYIYTMNDVMQQREFPDTVTVEKRSIDVHFQRKHEGLEQDFLSEALFMKTKGYNIPFRCLYSRNIDNLMMAGRCFSCSHIGLGGPRVMNTTGQMGIATGMAASLCIQYQTTPRGVYHNHIQELRQLLGYEAKSD